MWEIAASECYSDLDLVYLKLLHLSLGTKSVQKLGLCLGIALGNACFKYCQPGFSLLSLIIFYQTLAKYTSSMLFELLPLQNIMLSSIYALMLIVTLQLHDSFYQRWLQSLGSIEKLDLPTQVHLFSARAKAAEIKGLTVGLIKFRWLHFSHQHQGFAL